MLIHNKNISLIAADDLSVVKKHDILMPDILYVEEVL